MNKKIFIIMFLVLNLLVVNKIFAAELTYTALSTIPGVSTAGQPVNNPGDLVSKVYIASIGIGSILAVIMIVFSGIQHMVSEAVSTKSDAKNRIMAALYGLLLLLSSYLILKTINADLVSQKVSLPAGGITGITNQSGGSGFTPEP